MSSQKRTAPEKDNQDLAEEAATATAEETPDPEPAAESADEKIAQLKEQITLLEKEKQVLNDRQLRISAEFDNYKKRLDRQWEDFKRYAHESLIKELLPVVDNLERAVNAAADKKDDQDGLIEGVHMTLKEILRIFERFHITPIKAAGKPFDPNLHQAVAQQETDQVEENYVLEEYQKGYLIHDRLLRPAMVVVATGQTENQDKDTS